jgi:hypothetical protein
MACRDMPIDINMYNINRLRLVLASFYRSLGVRNSLSGAFAGLCVSQYPPRDIAHRTELATIRIP